MNPIRSLNSCDFPLRSVGALVVVMARKPFSFFVLRCFDEGLNCNGNLGCASGACILIECGSPGALCAGQVASPA